MFLDNKYSKWYFSIISRAQTRNYKDIGQIEWHHSIPKSLGGSSGHRVALTPREHYVCHQLLIRMLVGDAKKKMSWALHKMMFSENAHQTRFKPSSHVYAHFREMFYSQFRGKKVARTPEHQARINAANSLRLKGKTLPPEWRAKMSASRTGEKNGMFGRKHSLEAIAKMKEGQSKGGRASKGKTLTEEAKAKISARVAAYAAANPRIVSEETKRKISEARKRYWAEKRSTK